MREIGQSASAAHGGGDPLVSRLRVGFALCAAGTLPFAALDLLFAPDSKRLTALLLIKLMFMLFSGMAVFLLSRNPRRSDVDRIAVATIFIGCALTVASGVIAEDRVTAPILCLMGAFATATLLPWQIRYQALAAVAAGIAIAVHTVALSGAAALFSYPSAAIVMTLAVAVLIANDFDRQRATLAFKSRRLDEAEVTRKGSEARTAMIVRSALDCIVTVDADGEIVEFNPAAERVFGWKRDEVLGRKLTETIVPPEHRAAHTAGFARYMETGESEIIGQRLELEAVRIDGSRLPVEVAVIATDSGPNRMLTAFIRDITDRRLAEDALRRSVQAAEAASRAKSEFLTRMSHEIRTPMNGIIGMAELLRDTPLTAQQREYAEAVSSSADYLLGIVNDVLDAAKIESGRLILESGSFSPAAAVESTLQPMAVRARQKGLNWKQEVRADLGARVLGDARRFAQVVTNLCDNAVKFTERGDVSVVMTTQTEGDVMAVTVTVSDSGIGIAADKQSLIFDAFVQGDSSTTRRQSGTGLGLAVSAELARLMGGGIDVSSTAGRGSVFTFTARLPVDRSRSDNAPPPSDDAPLRILLVEDNPINQRLCSAQLEKQGHTVVIAENGRRAVDTYSADPRFDLVLMDLQMPEMDGFAATRAIREFERSSGRHVPILALTAHAVQGVREDCFRAGMDEYLSKPFRARDLIAALRRVRGLKEPLAPMPTAPPPAPASTADTQVWDESRALQQAGGDRDVLHQVVELFLNEDCGTLLSAIRVAMDRADGQQLWRAAHDLKGVVLNFGAAPTVDLARRLEALGREGRFGEASVVCGELERELARLKDALSVV